MPTSMRQFSIWLQPETLAELSRISKEAKRPVGFLIREIIEEHVEANPSAATQLLNARISRVENFKAKE
ncbi:MAG: hypothetical protein ACRDHZ_13745 [Ktedonobacteraceae bacterium]